MAGKYKTGHLGSHKKRSPLKRRVGNIMKVRLQKRLAMGGKI